jgi:hypothetical protein
MKDPVHLFTNMPSLLNPPQPEASWPVSLMLPRLDFSKFEISSDDNDTSSTTEDEPLDLVSEKGKRNKKTNSVCEHYDRKHYAKNMCNNCYHRYGRYQNAYSCPHKDRKLYAKGKCQFCYLSNYHRSQVFGRRRKRKVTKVKATPGI